MSKTSVTECIVCRKHRGEICVNTMASRGDRGNRPLMQRPSSFGKKAS